MNLKTKLLEMYEQESNWAHCCGQQGTGKDAVDELVNLIEQEKRKSVEESQPTTIMGHTIDEVCVILSALELERITELKMTMENLHKYTELLKEDLYNTTQKALNKSIDKALDNIDQERKRLEKQ